MRLIFAGTPAAAVPSLRRLIDSHHEVVAVLTRPDAPTGRGKRLARSEVGLLADEEDIPLLQPRGLRDPDAVAALAEYEPDAIPVVAYGVLVPPPALAVPRRGWINLHFSLLPAWRGAAPVQHAIWHGDDVTGATTFLLEEGLDTGPVLGTMVEPLGPTDTSGQVLGRLADSGAGLLLATLDGIESGELMAVPQPPDGVSLAPKITVDDARLDWTLPAQQVSRQVRACTPAPGAWTTFRGDRVKIFGAVPDDQPGADEVAAPGRLLATGRNRWSVACGAGRILLTEVQPAGKRRMNAADWLRGLPPVGDESMS